MTKRKPLSSSFFALAAVSSVVAPTAARAQEAQLDKAAVAQSLFNQATNEMDEMQYGSACSKLEEVIRLLPDGLGAKLTLAECHEARGKLASAWSQYNLVQFLAAKAGESRRSQEAAEKARGLRARVAMLRIEVPADVRQTAGVSITLDSQPVGEAQWGTSVPVDTGTHTIVARAPDRQPWEKNVEVTADGVSVVVTVHAPGLARDVRTGTVSLRWGQQPEGATGTEPPRQWQQPTGIVAMSLGAIGASMGAVLGGLSLSRGGDSRRDNHCNAQSVCDPVGLASRNEARAMGDGSTAAFIAGGVMLAGGLVLVITAPATPKKEQRSIHIEVASNGIRIGGTWQ